MPERLAENIEFLHEKHEDRQRGHGAGHADAKNELPGPTVGADPAPGHREHKSSRAAAEEQGHAERESACDAGLAPIPPSLLDIEFNAGDPDEYHHRPLRNSVELRDDLGGEHKMVVMGKERPEHARSKENAADDLHHDERREIFRPAKPPDEVRCRVDDDHGDEENFRGVHIGISYCIIDIIYATAFWADSSRGV